MHTDNIRKELKSWRMKQNMYLNKFAPLPYHIELKALLIIHAQEIEIEKAICDTRYAIQKKKK